MGKETMTSLSKGRSGYMKRPEQQVWCTFVKSFHCESNRAVEVGAGFASS